MRRGEAMPRPVITERREKRSPGTPASPLHPHLLRSHGSPLRGRLLPAGFYSGEIELPLITVKYEFVACRQ
jgi:hypothetical protein